MPVIIRPIEQQDNQAMATIIRSVFEELDLPKTGSSYADPEIDAMFEQFADVSGGYFIAEENSQFLGGCGIFPTEGLPVGCAELIKLYLSPIGRGRGIGRKLIEASVILAKQLKYQYLYLDSFPELTDAIRLYKKMGWQQIGQPLGKSGHSSCTIWLLREL